MPGPAAMTSDTQLRPQARIRPYMTARRALNPYDDCITSDQNFSLRWRFFSNFNTIKSTGQRIWFPARRCRCPDLRPAGPFGIPPYRFAALDPGRRHTRGSRLGILSMVIGCAALAPMLSLAAPPHAARACPPVLGGRRCVSQRGRADPARHAPRSPATTLWPHAASSGAACSP